MKSPVEYLLCHGGRSFEGESYQALPVSSKLMTVKSLLLTIVSQDIAFCCSSSVRKIFFCLVNTSENKSKLLKILYNNHYLGSS